MWSLVDCVQTREKSKNDRRRGRKEKGLWIDREKEKDKERKREELTIFSPMYEIGFDVFISCWTCIVHW